MITTTVITQRSVIGSSVQARSIRVTQVTTGLTGQPGSQGTAQISTDPGNALQTGTDNRLFVPRDPFVTTTDW